VVTQNLTLDATAWGKVVGAQGQALGGQIGLSGAMQTSTDIAVERRSFPLNGLELSVTLAGEGRPVLMLHGFPDSAELWRKMIPPLTEAGFAVVAPDQRGFGRSSAPTGETDYTVDKIVADAIALLDTLGLDQVDLVAHDWGAIIGWALVARHPERFRRYVAFSVGHPSSYADGGLEQKLKGWYVLMFQARGFAEAVFRAANFRILRVMTKDHPEVEHWASDMSRPGRLTAAINWYRANFKLLFGRPIGRVRTPVLGVWSSDDIALSEDQMTGSAKYMDAPFRYARLDGVGHWIPVDAPEAASRLVIDFLTAETV
jgi:pimeloyl-ACP methyl ester carboxylesterase